MNNKIFKPYSNNIFKGCYKHIISSDIDRITLSYGFYLRVPIEENKNQIEFISVQPNCKFNFPFGKGWYFGVNLRIKCQQNTLINQPNIDKAKNISQYFDKYIIPHYINKNVYDQGVDFFIIPLIKLSKDSHKLLLDGWSNNNFKQNQVKNIVLNNSQVNHNDIDIIDYELNIDSWVNYKLNVFLNLLERIK